MRAQQVNQTTTIKPIYIMASNLKAVDRWALKRDLTTGLSNLTSSTLTAAALNSVFWTIAPQPPDATVSQV
ncbi:hypothetical protein ACOMHN_033694 [Nucella lapillus]